jgi:hypothetical protein
MIIRFNLDLSPGRGAGNPENLRLGAKPIPIETRQEILEVNLPFDI